MMCLFSCTIDRGLAVESQARQSAAIRSSETTSRRASQHSASGEIGNDKEPLTIKEYHIREPSVAFSY
jgi:hypothetical protein